MRTVKRTMLTLTVGVLLLCEASAAHALQLVSNFGFDTALTTWDWCCGATGTVSWDATQDGFASDLSGSAKLVHTEPDDGNPSSLFVTKCLSGPDIAAGKQLFFGMKARFAPGESTGGQAYIAVEFRSEPACAGSTLAGSTQSTNTSISPRGTWVTVKRNPASAVTAPAGTKSLKLFAVVYKLSPGTLTVHLDDVYVAAGGTPLCDGLPATQVGTPDYDFINGTSASDVIVGKGGIDWIDGHEGNDHLCGGPGNDVLYGGTGDDRLFGEGGQDTLQGAADDDMLYGAGNNDTLEGGTGSDVLRGGSGVDTCTDETDGTTKFRKCEVVPTPF